MRLTHLAVVVLLLAACSPARFARELELRNTDIHRPPAEPVKQIKSAANGGDGTARPGAPTNVPVPVDATRPLPQDTTTKAGSNVHNRCDIPGKEGSASASCLGRYDVIKVAPRKKGPLVNR
jgi:hypothetical protein